MTPSQGFSVRISETRQALSQCIEQRNKLSTDQEPSAELVSKMDTLTKTLQRLEVEYRAALHTETSDETTEEGQDETRTADSEAAEREALLARASLVPFIIEATEGTPLTGAELEVRAAVFGDDARDRLVPLDLLLPQNPVDRLGGDLLETRADAATTVGATALADGSQAPVLPRVFARSIAARLGVSMPAVPVGAAVYPIMTAGTTGAMVADAAAHDAGAGVFSGHTLEPIRLTAAYLFNVRQTLQLRNFEAVLRRDLAAVMSDAMDKQIVNGTGADQQVTGFLAELTAAVAQVPATTWATFLAGFTAEVDGLNAFDLTDLRAVIGKKTFAYGHTLFRTGSTDNGPRESALEYVRQRIGGMSVSSRIPAGAATGQTNIMALTSYPGRNAVAPIWRGMELIRDPYTLAGSGQVRLTAVMFWNFKILREAGWKLWLTRFVAA